MNQFMKAVKKRVTLSIVLKQINGSLKSSNEDMFLIHFNFVDCDANPFFHIDIYQIKQNHA